MSSPLHHYRLYDFQLASELPLPELLPSQAGASAEVVVREGSVPADGIPGGERLGPFLSAAPGAFWLEVPGVARYSIREGREIVFEPLAGADADSIRVFLLGSCLGALMFQRGFLVLHGNAVQIGDSCMICVGASGAGKSTAAAGFLQRGHRVLADDVVPIDALGRALPGYPRIKLWQDTADHLGISTEGLRRIRPGLEKFSYPLADRFCGQALPVRWIYILSRREDPELSFEPIQGMQRFLPLRANTYRVRYLEGLDLQSRHLELCGALAAGVRMAKIGRPDHRFGLDALLDLILDDVAAHPEGR